MLKRPFHLMAKPSSFHCNIQCEYCFYLEKEKIFPQTSYPKQAYMNDLVLERYIRDYFAANNSEQVIFAWQGGEPTLLGIDFYRKAVAWQKHYSNGRPFMNSFQTNGIMLNQEWCEFFKENHFLIGISIDGLSEAHNAYRVFHNGAPTFDKVRKAIALLQHYQVDFNALTVVNDKNWDKGVATYTALKALGIHFIQFIPIVEPLETGGVSAFSVPSHGYGRFLVDIFHEWAKADVGTIFINEFDGLLAQWMGYASDSCIHAETCGDALIVEANGDVFSCDHFVYPQYYLGNLLTQPLDEIVHQQQQRQFGEAKRDTLTAHCLSCDVRRFCAGGCPKDRIVDIGELFRHNYLCDSYQIFYRETAPIMRKMATAIARGGLAADWQKME